ncbi:MAG: phage portal protein [Allosphingosinicella sp.]|uniref:phage portal protein n=1 Tax=Allosphingosinicella sp. TaxID=2823234 RepID=UPI00394AE19F
MGLGDWIDQGLAPFAPVWAARRMAAREGIRQFDAATNGRRTKGWRRPHTDADAENAGALARLRASGHDLVRNNKYAEAGVRHLVADMIGDGIAPQFIHADKAVAQKAQDEWDRWAEGPVDGRNDFYGVQKIGAWGVVVGGEALQVWKPDASGPDGRIEGLEGDHLDQSKIEDRRDGSRIVQGVEFDRYNDRRAYWMFDRHPGGMSLLSSYRSAPVPAQHVDHVYEQTRFGQTRGVSWLAAVALDMKDIGDIEDAVRMQQKVQACLGLILVPGEGAEASPLGATGEAKVDVRTGKQQETVTPGMIYRARHGDTVSTLNPAQTGGAVEFIRQQLGAISARLAPYHRMTGDVSQANYSSLRAAMLGSWALLDDWQQNVFIPHQVRPAVMRRMRRLAMETGDRRYLELRWNYALPVRRFVDPIKDLMAEIIEIRAGIKTLFRSLAERGINGDQHLAELEAINKQLDQLGLALDTDPRKLTDSGVLQKAVGYLAPKQATAED